MSHNYDRQHNDSDYASGRDDRDPYGPGGPSRRRHEDNFESNEPSYQSNTSRLVSVGDIVHDLIIQTQRTWPTSYRQWRSKRE